MLSMKIKQEKEDGMEAKNSAPEEKKDTNIVFKKKLPTNKSKRKKKEKTPLDKIKIKTFDEIMREKKMKMKMKMKKEKTEEVSSRAESTPSSTTTTTGPTTMPRTCTAFSLPLSGSKPLNRANVQLRQLSIPLMALPRGKHIIHTFSGSSFSSVPIKQETVDPQDQSSSEVTVSNTIQKPSLTTSVTTNHVNNSEPERQLNETDDNLFIRIRNKIRTERSNEDSNHNDVLNHTEDTTDKEDKEMPFSQECCESLSELSEENNSEQLSTSLDYSDVLLGSTQDDDTMSIYAFDDTFEEEIKPETPRMFTSDLGERRASKERDLRETLQNRARQKTQDEQRKVSKESNCRTVEDTKPNERQSSKRDGFKKQNIERKKDESLKVPYRDGRKNITGGGKKTRLRFQKLKNKNRGKSIPNLPFFNPNLAELQERQRLDLLRHVSLTTTSVGGLVASMQPLLNNNNILHYREDDKSNDPPLNRFRALRKPPPVSGGRGFFEDFKEHNKNELDFKHEDHRDHSRDSWRPKDERVVATGESSTSARRHGNREDSTNYRRPLKRGSRNDGEGRVAKESKRDKQRYCGTQLRLGECHHSYCRLYHLTSSELEEYKKSGKIISQEEKEEQPEPPEPPELEQVNQGSSTDEEHKKLLRHEDEDEKKQMCKGLAEAANQLLDSLKLAQAWKVIHHLYQSDPVEREPLIKLLERSLFLCGEDGVDTNDASQVSAKVFDLIPCVRGSYNRHDFTTLIHCLCRTGQYIRGYEVLQEMRKANISATHEVYIDLIHSSEAVPNWAFDLLEEVKALGLFKSSICSALILLGAKSGIELLERTWKLFKDMMENSVKPSAESFLAFLDFLAENNEGEKLLDALVSHNDPSIKPSPKCNKLIIRHSKDNAELVSINVASVCGIAKTSDPLLDVETWNILLRNCYSEKFNLVVEAQDVYSMMKKYNIPLTAEGYNGLLCALSKANQTISAMQVFKTLSLASGNIKGNDYRSCIAALISALLISKQIEDLELVVVFAVDNGLMVEEKALLLVITKKELERKFEEIHQLFKKLQSLKEEIPLSVFRKLVSTLEKWAVNPAASLAVYAAMKRAYPIIPDNAQQFGRPTSGSTAGPAANVKKIGCRYIWTEKGCAFGSLCKFSHAPSDAAFTSNTDVAAINTTSPKRSNPFVLKSASFPLSGNTIPPPTQPPLYPFSMNNGGTHDNLIPPTVFASNSPFVLKDPNPLTAFQPTAVPPVAFQFGFPQASFFAPSIPVSAATGIQSDQKIPIPSSIQAGTERHSVELPSTTASVSTANSRGAQSAPILSYSHGDEGFHFPVKTELQFYKPKILKATEEKDLEELARLYVQMKKEQVPAKNEMLLLFYDFLMTCKDIGESLSSFVAIIDIQLDNLDEDEDSSQKEALDLDDLKFIGELGVALMQFCRLQERLDEGYLVLHVLHQYGVNYFQYPASFVPGGKALSSQGIALLATDMCLCLTKDPQFDGAVEVLRGCNYALPLEESPIPAEEAEKRRSTFEKLSYHYLNVGNYALVYELLQHVGDKDVFGMTSLKSIYNELLKKYIAEEKVDDAIGVIREMENELISRDPNVLRALVTCLGNIGRFVQANEIFKSSCLQGAYPTFPLGDELWKATVWISFSKFEIQFYLKQHLQLLNKYFEQHRIASQLPYDEKHLKSLRIIITKEESSGFISNIAVDAAKQMQEKIIDILRSDFNPPLSCGISDKVGEVIVNPRSLRRWFLANPPSEMNLHASPLSESDGSTELTRNVTTSKGKTGITIRVDNLSHIHPQRTTLFEEYEPRIRHTVCGHLTRYLRQGKLANKEEFKRLARELTQDFLRTSNLVDLNKDYKQVRGTVISFVDKYFVM